MARPSKIDRLPPEIREEIGKLRADGRTIDEILGKLRELNVNISRSGLGRHIQHLDVLQADLQESRASAEALIAKLGEAPESRTARLNIELLQSCIMRLQAAKRSDGGQFNIKEVYFLSDALHRLARASKDDADTHAQIRKQAREAAAEAATKAAKAHGLSADTVDAIKAEILGIRK